MLGIKSAQSAKRLSRFAVHPAEVLLEFVEIFTVCGFSLAIHLAYSKFVAEIDLSINITEMDSLFFLDEL